MRFVIGVTNFRESLKTVFKMAGADASDTNSDEGDQPSRVATSNILLGAQPAVGSSPGEWFVERSKFIPVRLTLQERKWLRLLEAALQVSEYTDKIDTIGFGLSKAKRIVQQIRELCAILSGLVLAADYKQVKHRSFHGVAPLLTGT